MSNLDIGKIGEDISCEYIKKKLARKILYRNYRSVRWGEIDIISVKDNEIFFTEVKTRTSLRYGNPDEAISFYKMKSLRRAINYFLTHEGEQYQKFAYNIEFVGIILNPKSKKIEQFDHLVM